MLDVYIRMRLRERQCYSALCYLAWLCASQPVDSATQLSYGDATQLAVGLRALRMAHAAQNLGPRGRTLHSANGLKTARLRLNPQTQKKMDRLAGETGIDVIDELGCVSVSLLHADALEVCASVCTPRST